MSRKTTTQLLYDPRKGSEAIRLTVLAVDPGPVEPARTNYFAIYWIKAGSGEFWADTGRHSFAAGSLLFFTPYQYIRITPKAAVQGVVIQFHANFLCVETFHAESGCAGALFSDSFRPPVIALNRRARGDVARIVDRMQGEQEGRALAFEEMLLAKLKILEAVSELRFAS